MNSFKQLEFGFYVAIVLQFSCGEDASKMPDIFADQYANSTIIDRSIMDDHEKERLTKQNQVRSHEDVNPDGWQMALGMLNLFDRLNSIENGITRLNKAQLSMAQWTEHS